MRALILVAALIAIPLPAAAYEYGLEPHGQIQVTASSATDSSIARVWALDDGTVVSRRDVPLVSGGGDWVNHGHGGAPSVLHGVAATSYLAGASMVERVFYIGQNNALFMGTSTDGGPVTWQQFAPPAGGFFIGHIAATTWLIGGVRHVIVVAPGTGGQLWRWVQPVAGGAATWTNNTSLPWIGQYNVSVTKNPAETIVSFFTDHTIGNRQVGMLRLNGSTASVVNVGKPVGQTCVTTTAVQGVFSQIVAGYRLSVGCTTVNQSFHIASTTSETSTSFTWTSHALTTFPTAFSAIASTVRPGNFALSFVHEMFVVTASHTLMRVSIGNSSTTLTDLGPMRDMDSVTGGLAVRPRSGSSRVFYVAKLTDGHRMFERRGFASNNPGDYRWHGSPSNQQFWPTPQQAAESKVSSWRGTQALAVMNRPGTGGLTDWPTVYLALTTNQNEVIDFSRSKAVTKSFAVPGVGTVLHNYVADPTVVVSDDKVAYSFQLGLQRIDCPTGQTVGCGCQSTTPVTRATIYMVSTTDGITHSAPTVIASLTGGSQTTPIDHPWADIERRPNNNDIIHLAWWDLQSGTLKYAEFIQYVGLQPIRTIRTSGSGPPKVTASDSGRVVVYLGVPGGPVEMCELNAARTACTTAPGQNPLQPGWTSVGSFYYQHAVPVTPTSSVRSFYSVSMALSETDASTINYCFEVVETDLTDSDVRCGRIARAADGSWAVASAVIANAVPDDDKDQFLPEIYVTSEDDGFGAQDTVFASWFDRANSATNRTYQVARAVSLDGGATFAPPVLHSYISDPEFLPRHCHNSTIRFAGDYNAVEGDLLHKNAPAVFVAPGGTITTWMYSLVAGLGAWGE